MQARNSVDRKSKILSKCHGRRVRPGCHQGIIRPGRFPDQMRIPEKSGPACGLSSTVTEHCVWSSVPMTRPVSDGYRAIEDDDVQLYPKVIEKRQQCIRSA